MCILPALFVVCVAVGWIMSIYHREPPRIRVESTELHVIPDRCVSEEGWEAVGRV